MTHLPIPVNPALTQPVDGQKRSYIYQGEAGRSPVRWPSENTPAGPWP